MEFSERSSIDNATWFKYHPYAEWYMNTARIHGSPSYDFHKKHFGKLSYIDAFVPRFNKATGLAKRIILVLNRLKQSHYGIKRTISIFKA